MLIIGAEAQPFSKTGGLADVLGALPRAVARLGWSVTLALPRYRGVLAGREIARFPIILGNRVREVGFFEEPLAPGAAALLIDCPEFYDREALYGIGSDDYPDNALRFAMLARAALEFVRRRGLRPSVVHAHDWQAGLAPVYLKTRYATDPVLGGTPAVFTIHNLAYQGLFDSAWLSRVDLPPALLSAARLEYWGRISYLKGGITEAETITTVSPTYAAEIQTPALGFGFDGILRHRSADLVGILNGIDTDIWDPAHDRFLPRAFSQVDLTGKAAAKRAVLERFGLARAGPVLVDGGTAPGALSTRSKRRDGTDGEERPLIGLVSRMVDQKGFDLLEAAAGSLLDLDALFVLLGTGETRYQASWLARALKYPDRIGVRIGFDEEMAHLIEAGADLFLMPSRFEPCGLNQMYSLRYGTVPVVHGVGGLADTVRDYRPGDAASTGFVFTDYTGAGLLGALQRALELFRDRPRWRVLQVAGMRQDHSWDRSAREYVKIYERAARRPVAGA